MFYARLRRIIIRLYLLYLPWLLRLHLEGTTVQTLFHDTSIDSLLKSHPLCCELLLYNMNYAYFVATTLDRSLPRLQLQSGTQDKNKYFLHRLELTFLLDMARKAESGPLISRGRRLRMVDCPCRRHWLLD